MNVKLVLVAAVVGMTVLCAVIARRGEADAAAPGPATNPSTSPSSAPGAGGADTQPAMEMSVSEVPPMKVLYSSRRTTFAKMGDIGVGIGALYQEARRAGLEPAGPLHFLYRDMPADHAAEFTLELALPIRAGAQVQPPFATKDLAEFKCAVVSYVGPMPTTPGWRFLDRASREAGHQHTGEIREVYQTFVSPDSPRNVTLLQSGIR